MKLPVLHFRFLVGRNGNSYVPALLAFGVGLALTWFISVLIVQYQNGQTQDAFRRDTGRITALTETRLLAHFETLLAVKGLFAAGDRVDRAQFKHFLDQMQLKRNHPGFQAIQFVRSVPAAQREAFVQAVRRDASLNGAGYPYFTIRPPAPRAQHYVIEFTEPQEGNEAAFGLDLASMPSHLKALELGRDSGEPVATERVKLVQDTSGQAGFVVRAPLYQNGMPLNTVDERRAALFGFAAIVYRVNDLMKEVVDPQLIPHMHIAIHDAGYASAAAASAQGANLMFDSRSAYGAAGPAGEELAELQARHTLEVGQRRWELHFQASHGTRYGRNRALVAGAALSGIIISALIATLMIALGRRRMLSAQLGAAVAEQSAILDNATVGIELIKQRTIARCNEGMARMLGYAVRDLVGKSTRLKFPTEQAYLDMGEAAQAALASGGSWIGDVEWLRKDGSAIWCRVHGKLVAADDAGQGSIWVSYDITAQRLADAAIKQANQSLERSLVQVEKTYLGVTHLSELSSYLQACPTLADALRCICAFAPRLFPDSAGAVYLMDADNRTLVEKASWGSAPPNTPSFQPSDCWALRRGQPYRTEANAHPLCCPHLPDDGQHGPSVFACLPLVAQANTFGLLVLEHLRTGPDTNADMRYRLGVAMAEHIGLALANMQLRDTLRQQSIRDPLTGLFNRRHMNDVLQRELARAERKNAMMAFTIIDVDHFKRFNDTHGHDAGDAVLQAVAACIEAQVRESDIVCRFGGEEFVVVLSDISTALARLRCEEIRAAIAVLEVRHAGQPLGGITASLGLAFYPHNGRDAATLIKAADAALYRAKEGGRDRVAASA